MKDNNLYFLRFSLIPPTQVTLNNVEVCSENITTLKRNLEVKSTSLPKDLPLLKSFSYKLKLYPGRMTAPSCLVREWDLESRPKLKAACLTWSAHPLSSKISYRLVTISLIFFVFLSFTITTTFLTFIYMSAV